MSTALIQRYQPGGDLFAQYSTLYGPSNASAIANAALSGDRTEVTNAIDRAKFGNQESESTLKEFGRLLTTDPFGAPLESANTAIGNVAGSAIFGLFKNPWVLVAVALGIILWAGGGPWLARQLRGVFK